MQLLIIGVSKSFATLALSVYDCSMGLEARDWGLVKKRRRETGIKKLDVDADYEMPYTGYEIPDEKIER